MLRKKEPGVPHRDKKKPKPYSNGWFVVCDPSTCRIVSVTHMLEPENNTHKIECIEKILHLYKNVDLFIHDLACKLAPAALNKNLFPQIKFWSVDRFHSKKHGSSCRYSPHNIPEIEKRIEGVNTSCSEQTFSWLAKYAKFINELRPNRHKLLLLYFCKKHNELVNQNRLHHLNPFSKKIKRKPFNRKRYICRKNNVEHPE